MGAKSFQILGFGIAVGGRCLLAVAFCALTVTPSSFAQTNAPAVPANLLAQPLSLVDALNLTLEHNSAILKGKADLEISHAVVVQTRAIALPRLSANGSFNAEDTGLIEKFPVPAPVNLPAQNWTTDIRVEQSIYEGGKIGAALRAAKLTREQAILNYQTVVQDTLLSVRTAYDDALLAIQEIQVQEASVNLLTNELVDVQRRFDAGTVPRFNVLRAEVEVANARPRLIKARNAFRIAKNNLSNLLGYNLPRTVWEDVPLQLSGKLEAVPLQLDLPAAIDAALDRRTELAALRKAEGLNRENIINAKAGTKPSAQIFAGYEWRSPQFKDDLAFDLNGWIAGAKLSMSIFDGQLTRGKVQEAEARLRRAKLETEDTGRRIELEVRTSYSDFVQAKEVLESQQKVVEEAEEAHRLAEARMSAGTGTQLDVLDAQTSLTQARTTQIEALHDYSVARAKLRRAIGADLQVEEK